MKPSSATLTARGSSWGGDAVLMVPNHGNSWRNPLGRFFHQRVDRTKVNLSMAVEWNESERARVEDSIRRYPVASGLCAALARVVFRLGQERDAATRGRQVRPPKKSAARFIVPKVPHPPRWGSHTFVEAHEHAIDALTGANGCPAPAYLETHWEYADHLEVHDVDVEAIDPGIQDEP